MQIQILWKTNLHKKSSYMLTHLVLIAEIGQRSIPGASKPLYRVFKSHSQHLGSDSLVNSRRLKTSPPRVQISLLELRIQVKKFTYVFAVVAQLVEYVAVNHKVVGSQPTDSVPLISLSRKQRDCKSRITCASHVQRTLFLINKMKYFKFYFMRDISVLWIDRFLMM